jgi:hypothetical protein
VEEMRYCVKEMRNASDQKEGEMIFGVEILNILNTNSTRFVGNFQQA